MESALYQLPHANKEDTYSELRRLENPKITRIIELMKASEKQKPAEKFFEDITK